MSGYIFMRMAHASARFVTGWLITSGPIAVLMQITRPLARTRTPLIPICLTLGSPKRWITHVDAVASWFRGVLRDQVRTVTL